MAKINISIDDMCPHPQSSVKVLDMCYDILENFPNVKFSLFIPMSYTRYKEKSYPINEYKNFCSILKSLPLESFELGWHGYYHGILNQSNNDEFRYLSYPEACDVLDKMFMMAKVSGVYDLFSPVLRPPAFWMSPQSIKACEDKGIKTLSLISSSCHKECYGGADEKFYNVVYYDYISSSSPIILKDRLQILYHACEWDKSYFSKKMVNKLKDFLLNNKIEYSFIRDL